MQGQLHSLPVKVDGSITKELAQGWVEPASAQYSS